MAHFAISVNFHDSMLYIVNNHGEPYIPMKFISEGMGMCWQRQRTKLKGRFNTYITEIWIHGHQTPYICLSLDMLDDWMKTIHPNKVKSQSRGRVTLYQRECDNFLRERWNNEVLKGQCILRQNEKSVAPPTHRYSVEVHITDNMFGGQVIIPGKADTFNAMINGIAGRLGWRMLSMEPIKGWYAQAPIKPDDE
ncbi:P22_AR N-terminal domain [Serratia plymuthica]|nr:P22_AR N-terminal domain [Serratia plymuthica]